ncbi:MAG: HAD hydrolase family protein [Comamonadaceae bacterium]|nr:HAD hydrolase family protein [Comamonadaceae bacterium]
MRLEHVVTDFTGTLSVDGTLLPGVGERLVKVSGFLRLHVLTADTFGKAMGELQGLTCEFHMLQGGDHDVQKEQYVMKLGPQRVVALGNGNNDRKMLKAARVGIALCLQEGCSKDALTAADILVTSANDALDLLLHPLRMKATLRF